MKSLRVRAQHRVVTWIFLLVLGETYASPFDLQMLIDHASEGDTLRLELGVYGRAVINKPLTLIGQGRKTLLDGNGVGHTLSVIAPDVSLRDIHVTNSGRDVTNKESCIWVGSNASRANITRVDVEQCGFGIWVDAALAPKIANCRVIGQRHAKIVSDLGNGIHLFNVMDGVVVENEVLYGRDGIYISNSTGCQINNNRINHSRFAIHYMYSHANHVKNNHADSSSVGLALMYSKNLEIVGNSVRGNSTHGIFLRNLYFSRIVGNLAAGNADGFFLSGCSYDTLKANVTAGNMLGILVSDSKDNIVSGNAIRNNVEQISYQDNYSQFWQGNYWSDYLGWDRDGDGVGDQIHYPVDIVSGFVSRYPVVRMIMYSPVMKLLQAMETQFPVLRPPGIIESEPLIRNPILVSIGGIDG